MDGIQIDERVELIKQNETERSKLIEEYLPFIRSWAGRLCGHSDITDRDEYSIALLAFDEAIRTYRKEKGAFLAFAKQVIKRRVIDHWRKNNRNEHLLHLDEFEDGEEHSGPDLLGAKAAVEYREQNRSEDIRLEILQYTEELQDWDISFASLAELSPKHQSNREDCKRIIHYIVNNHEIAQQIQAKKKIPIQNIAQITKVPPKKVEKLRKYIIAVLIVLQGDYQYIREFVVGGWMR